MDTLLSVTAAERWTGTASGNRDTGLPTLGKGNTTLGRTSPYTLLVQLVNLIKNWVLVLVTEAFKSHSQG